MSEKAIVDLGGLSKPATVLVEKISEAVGGIAKPYQLVRVAKAQAKADLIKAHSEIEITDLHRRAMHRFVEEEAKRQENIEAITEKALPMVGETAKPEEVETDWITNFFDKGRIVSDEEMQQLWAKVLAGEASSPGNFSKKTVNLLSDLDKRDAELFRKLCGFGWVIGNVVPVVFDVRDKVYKDGGIDFESLKHLESLGLIHFEAVVEYTRTDLPQAVSVSYYGQPLQLRMPNADSNRLGIGKVILTNFGQELAPVCGSTPVDGFFDFVKSKWDGLGLLAPEESTVATPAQTP